MRKTLTFGVFILAIVMAGSFLDLASAQEAPGPQAPTAVLLADDFSFSGPLTSNGWTAHSGAGTNPISTTTPGLTYSGYVGSGVGNAAGIVATGEDVHRTFAVQTSGTVYAAVLVNFSDATTDPLGGYFFHLGPDPISTTFRGRVFVKKDGSNNLAFGISKAGNAAAGDIAFTPFSYAMNTTHLLVVKYSIIAGATNDTIDLFVNPVLGGAEPAANVTAPDVGAGDIDPASVAIRQGEASRGPVGSVDGVRVATSWSDLGGGGQQAPTPAFRLFTAHLNGAKENPPVNTTGHGFGRVVLNDAENQITVSVYYNRLSSGTTMGHIHGPAAPNANAGILFDLMPPTGQTNGSVTNMTFNVTPAQVADLRAGLWYFNIHTTNFSGGEIRGQILPPDAPSDFNGDGKTDYAIIRGDDGGAKGTSTWWINFNGTDQVKVDSFGFNDDFFLPADYDGDGADDIAVWRGSDMVGFWVLRSSDGTATFTSFGQQGDQPNVVGDYTGDGRDDYAIYRPGATDSSPSEFWYVASSGIYSGLQVVVQWGLQSDTPMIGDYDGNGLADFTVIRPDGPRNAVIYTLTNEADGTIGDVSIRQFGFFDDFFVPGDYDGDGITDLAISRAVGSSLRWIYRPSSGGPDVWVQWGRGGGSPDIEAPGDYDGDGKTDIAVWRPGSVDTPGSSTFIIKYSSGGFKYHPWGLAGDVVTLWQVVQ